MKRIAILHTGGTFSMQSDDQGLLTPGNYALDYIQKTVPPLFNAELHQKQLFNLDSSLFRPEHWVGIANEVYATYDDFDGFVVVHGTDTMAYTAAALSFFLKNLGKPVVLTGSQLPLKMKRSDALSNLISAVEVANSSDLREVAVQFNNTVFRGNRVKKKDAWDFDAFYSPNYRTLVKLGITMEQFHNRFFRPASGVFEIDTRLDPRVLLVPIFPGFDYTSIVPAVEGGSTRGIVIEAYGSGNVPSDDPGLEALFKAAADHRVPIAVCSQSPAGKVNLRLYKVASRAEYYGLVSAVDMTREATIVKLMVALGRYADLEKIKRFMQLNIAGEKEDETSD
ncbi:MAG: asparaginase [Spirochaetes bacterium]|nr:asparaginase [Spirochaetota bacterium]MBU1080646.1 asparaginase [Spirochaetota bacterium]